MATTTDRIYLSYATAWDSITYRLYIAGGTGGRQEPAENILSHGCRSDCRRRRVRPSTGFALGANRPYVGIMLTKELRRPSAIVLMLAGMSLSAACAPRTEWAKDGGVGDAATLRQDREACLKESGDAGFVLGRSGGDPETEARDRRLTLGQGEIYRLCMQSRGWQRRPVKPVS